MKSNLNFFSSCLSQPRFRIRENTQRFRFDAQESQWSASHTQNSFQPFDETFAKASISKEIDDNQEIVTAGPIEENVIKIVN